MGYSVKILADSVNAANGRRITTWELSYPRFIHSEIMTHRMLSKNSASSRAIPVSKLIERVRKDPVKPVWWGANQAGMQAKAELVGWRRWLAEWLWLQFRWFAILAAWSMLKIGLHKQIANRILEPWMFITIIMTATEHENLFKLRCHPDAQPEFQHIALMMRELYRNSTPMKVLPGQWHIPLVDGDDIDAIMENRITVQELVQIATGRCARVSYLTHDGKRDFKADLDLHDKLKTSGHWSPFEHCAMAVEGDTWIGNFQGWKQYRKDFTEESGRA